MRRRAYESLGSLLRMCFAREPSAADLYTMLGYNVSVPPSVPQALFSRVLDNDDLLMPEAGHAPFWDAAASFNRRLGAFCEEVVRGELIRA
jgi:hypothetical protein